MHLHYLGLFTRLAAVPLLIVIIVAFIATKVLILTDKGFGLLLMNANRLRYDAAVNLSADLWLGKQVG